MARVLAQPEWDTDKPTLSWALACSDAALELYSEDGRRDKKLIMRARDAFRGALDRGADKRGISLAWYFMELGCGDTAAARACLEGWRRRSRGGAGNAELWRNYVWFECQYGTRASARAVAQAAVAACPRDPEVFSLYARVELHLGCDRRARRLVAHARDVVFAADEAAAKRIEKDVEWCRRHLRAHGRPTIGDIFRCLFHHCSRGGSAY